MRKFSVLLILLLSTTLSHAQDDISYKLPPKEIADLLLAKPTPSVTIDSKAEWMLFMESNSYPSVAELAEPEFKIAGLRINPNNFAPSRQTFINDLYLKNIPSGKEYKITGLPANLLASSINWSPNEKKIAFTNTTDDRVDLYVIDLASKKAIRVNKQPLNVLLGGSYQWFDDNSLLYKTIIKPASTAPPKPMMPIGPSVQENIGKTAPARTYQDLIRTAYDEQLFEFFTTAQLVKNVNGEEVKIGQPSIFSFISVSPDKKYLLTREIKKPFSYLVPAAGFPTAITLKDLGGKTVKLLADLPSSELAPSGFDNVQNIPRGFNWRDDEPATVYWALPLDSGMIRSPMEKHDVVYSLAAPFTGQPKELFKTEMRFRGIQWGNETLALVTEGLTGKQVTRTYRFDPSGLQMEKLWERNTTDAYSNPGNPLTEKNKWGREVIKSFDANRKLLMNNTTGASAKGDLPFLAVFDLDDKKPEIIWRSKENQFEYIVKMIDFDKRLFITRKESEKDVPNFYRLDLKNKDVQPLTAFTDPYPQLQGITKEKIRYKRADGVDLTGDLYLPKGYDPKKDGKLPVFIWAYPAEFQSAADAAQIRGSQHRFTSLNWASPVFWVTQGYAVLNNAEMPIVSTDKEKKPNDNFIDQLRMNAEAAINALDSMGVGDKNKVAVGGHSYGAFMTANLLAHTNLFKAGIARSGAYNRTLTPFGFQNEDRTYWDDPQLYFDMSPFSFANKIKTPLLLVHGEMDDNPGTFPIQSERMYNAVKGFGGTVRYVVLPYEAHGYRGRENILHMLYEMNAWMDKYVKNADKKETKAF
jgi:dipeptidyl aminopeptidase/acylaminoacyl peptidase